MPTREPTYRHHRPHKDFLVNLAVTKTKLQTALRSCWEAEALFSGVPAAKINALARTQYLSRDWTFKF